MKPTLHLRLLGGFALEHGGEPLAIASPRLQALLGYMALHRDEPQPRRRVAFLLWPDSSEAQAQTNLRTVLHRFAAALPAVSPLLQIEGQAIAWAPDQPLALDVEAFEGALRETAEDGALAIGALERAVSLYTGDLLPDCYDEWAQPTRDRLRNSLLDALGRLAALLEQHRDYQSAIRYARQLAQLEPLNEATYLTLMRLHALGGDRAGALRAYHACASILQQELGAAPGAALREAYEQLVAATSSAVQREEYAATALIGRDAEWRRMQVAWQTANAGRPLLLLLVGEAGVGKTRLAEELLRWAARQGVVAAMTQCYPAEGTLAYAPIIAWLRADTLRPHLRQLSAPWLAELGRLHPDLVAGRRDLPEVGPLSESWQRQRLFEALARAVLVADRPTILLLDDVQWCDRDSLEWLHFLLRFDPRARLMIVCTLRVEELGDAPLLGPLLEALRGAGRAIEVQLGPLTGDETAELAQHIAGHTLGDEQRARVFAETEGNPLFIVEMLRAGLAGAELPAGVQAVLTRRLQQVAREAREVLGVAAVIGRSFTFDVLAHAAELDDNAVVRGLDELWQRRIVREQGADAYDFTHERLRAAAYNALSPARRRWLHGRVASALEAAHPPNLDAVSGQIAAHFERAGKRRQAAAYAQRAAEAAHRLYATVEALDHYRRALDLLGPDSPAEAAAIQSRLGDLLHLLGRYDEARASWRRALADTPATDGIELAHLHRKIGNAFRDEYRYEDAGRAYDAAEAALPPAAATSNERSALGWAQLELDRITLDYWLGEIERMLRRVERLRPVLETVGEPTQRARLYQIGAIALMRRDRYAGSPEAVTYTRAYLEMLETLRDPHALPAAHFQLGFALLWSGDLADAERHIAQALALAERSDDLSLQGRCLTYLTIIARWRGDAETVLAYAQRSLQVAEAGHMHDYIGAAHGNLAWLAWRSGDLAAVRSHGLMALDAWQKLPAGYICEWTARWPLIAISLAEGNAEAAAEHARSLLDVRQQRPPPVLEAALEGAVGASSAGDLVATHQILAASQTHARNLGYL